MVPTKCTFFYKPLMTMLVRQSPPDKNKAAINKNAITPERIIRCMLGKIKNGYSIGICKFLYLKARILLL